MILMLLVHQCREIENLLLKGNIKKCLNFVLGGKKPSEYSPVPLVS